MVEDFGYQRDEERSRFSVILKRAFLIGAVLFSISCFIYITINAYNFVYHEQNNNVTTIKSPDSPIKVMMDENKGGTAIKDMDKTVYENIVGNKRESLEKGAVNVVKIPEEPMSPASGKVKIISNQNIVKPITIDNKPATGDEESEFKTIDQSTKEHTSKPVAAVATNAAKLGANPVKSKNVSRVQLAAMNSSTAANDYWQRLNNKYPRLFSGLKPFVQEVKLGQKGTFYRLQIGDFRSQIEAEDFCVKFIAGAQKTKADCIVVE
jgi:hypothetical protein